MADATAQADQDGRPRYLPDEAFPAYSYVTGRFPHPLRDPSGHSFGKPAETYVSPNSSQWQGCRPYLHGIDLFNHGYYWEAHEAWEGLWHACGRTGPASNFFKGLIKLAAAGVKVREGRLAGVQTHALRAAELFRLVTSQIEPLQSHYFGLSLIQLCELAEGIANGSIPTDKPPEAAVEIVFPFFLQPGDPPAL